jgi:hypothetical protein
MHARQSFVFVLLFLTALAGDAAGQRGRGNMSAERPETPARFDSQELGIAFDAPPGARIYTPEAPGRYKSALGDGRFVYVESSEIRNATVLAKSSPNATEAELKGYKDILDANPPQAKLEGFKKHSLRFIKIGKEGGQEALEFVYDTQLVTIRQVVFIHNGRGITFTCTSLQAQYGTAEAELFKPLFSRLEFR